MKMDRRTFLKGLFATAVTPASAVRALYQPEAVRYGIAYWVNLPEGAGKVCLPPLLIDRNIKIKNYVCEYQPPKRRT